MRKKAIGERQKLQQEKEAYLKLKIRNCIDQSKPKYKYYAIKHPTDLIITNSWDMATDIIASLNASGTPCKYKSFTSLEQAREYLRS